MLRKPIYYLKKVLQKEVLKKEVLKEKKQEVQLVNILLLWEKMLKLVRNVHLHLEIVLSLIESIHLHLEIQKLFQLMNKMKIMNKMKKDTLLLLEIQL